MNWKHFLAFSSTWAHGELTVLLTTGKRGLFDEYAMFWKILILRCLYFARNHEDDKVEPSDSFFEVRQVVEHFNNNRMLGHHPTIGRVDDFMVWASKKYFAST